MGRSQDAIGWRRFMKGMISKEILPLQEDHITLGHGKLTLDQWAQGLVIKLLEVTHGQWLYRNIHVHDATAGVAATARKEKIQQFIRVQMDLREDGLDKRDHYLLCINLGDLVTSSGEDLLYWLLQIEAARRKCALMDKNKNSNNSRNTQRGGRA